jgi:hypothetical protein
MLYPIQEESFIPLSNEGKKEGGKKIAETNV